MVRQEGGAALVPAAGAGGAGEDGSGVEEEIREGLLGEVGGVRGEEEEAEED